MLFEQGQSCALHMERDGGPLGKVEYIYAARTTRRAVSPDTHCRLG
jgi:hypothetical protein